MDEKALEAVIENTAQRTVKEAMKEFRKEMTTQIELHSLKCSNAKLGAFKTGIISVIAAGLTLFGRWFLEKIKGV